MLAFPAALGVPQQPLATLVADVGAVGGVAACLSAGGDYQLRWRDPQGLLPDAGTYAIFDPSILARPGGGFEGVAFLSRMGAGASDSSSLLAQALDREQVVEFEAADAASPGTAATRSCSGCRSGRKRRGAAWRAATA